MKFVLEVRVFIWCLLAVSLLCGFSSIANGAPAESKSIKEWEVQWGNSEGQAPENIPSNVKADEWQRTDTRIQKPESKDSVWIRVDIPTLNSATPGILFDKIYGKRISIFADQEKIYESSRSYNYQLNQILLPLQKNLSATYLYIWIESSIDHVNLQDRMYIGDFHGLLIQFVQNNLSDIVLGSTFIFIACVMLIWSFFLSKRYIESVISLSLVILSVGILVFTYSPFLYMLFENHGRLLTQLYDISLLILLPSFSLFFENIFGPGWKGLLRKLRRFQMGYSAFCLMFMFINFLYSDGLYELYYFFSVKILGLMMIIQFILLFGSSMIYAFKGNRTAVIFNLGFALFAGIGLGELIRFFISGREYQLVLWKWGVAGFIGALILILGRVFAQNHEQVIQYSKELKMFNEELQRSEKMEIISELAASVAHEVRNPLQVTKGFLQLLCGKTKTLDREYLDMALVELDRASNIITDFLTFAKPEHGKTSVLQVADEFKHIEGILTPLAQLQGGSISVDIPSDICIYGNSSKFKQALINIIKNSIEALEREGHIHIRAYCSQGHVFIHVQDDGEGMDPEILIRLGEPYFSNKTKGTGLGLMVTFRIIEGMQGKIHYNSKKGVGTEAVISLPAAGVNA